VANVRDQRAISTTRISRTRVVGEAR